MGKLNVRVFCQSAIPSLTKVCFKNGWRKKALPEGLGSVETRKLQDMEANFPAVKFCPHFIPWSAMAQVGSPVQCMGLRIVGD